MFSIRHWSLFAGCALALGVALPGSATRLDTPAPAGDEEPVKKDEDKKKKDVTVWVLQAKGPS